MIDHWIKEVKRVGKNDNYNKKKQFIDNNVHTTCMCGYVNRLC